MVGEQAAGSCVEGQSIAVGGGGPSPAHAPEAAVLFTLGSTRALSSQLECRQRGAIPLSRLLADVSPAP